MSVPSTIHRLFAHDEAFQRMHGEFVNKLYRYLLIISRSPETAKDLSQEVWLKVSKIRHQTRVDADAERTAVDPVEFGASAEQWRWLSRAALNEYIDWYRKKKPTSLEDLAQFVIGDSNGDATSDDLIHRLDDTSAKDFQLRSLRELFDAVLEAFTRDTSPPHQSIVFGYNRPLQWTPQEIAQECSDGLLGCRRHTNSSGTPKDVAPCCLFQGLSEEMTTVYRLTKGRSQIVFRGLNQRLDQKDRAGKRAGNAKLKEYFRKSGIENQAREIAHWSLAVQRRILKQVVTVTATSKRSDS